MIELMIHDQLGTRWVDLCITLRKTLMTEYQSVRQDFIVPTNRERRDMVGNIILSFSTLAATFRLKAPLPPYLPPVEESRLRLARITLYLH